MVTYRTSGPWGPGKGSNLVEAEVDQNFYEQDQRIVAVETNPPQPVSIDHFVVEGTLMTIVLTDGTEHGPFVLPIGQWRFTGPWQPLTQYFVGDLCTDAGALYFIRVQHISEDTFDPGLFAPEGNVYELILPAPVAPYDIAMFYRDRVIAGTAVIALHLLARDVELPADFAGSVASLNVAPTTSAITLPIFHNATQIGTVTFDIGSVRGGFTGLAPPSPPPSPLTLAANDTIDVRLPPEADDTATGLAVTIVGSTLSVPPPSP